MSRWNPVAVLFDSTGKELVVKSGDPVTADTPRLLLGGVDTSGNMKDVTVESGGAMKTNTTLTVDVMGVGNIYGYDNYPSAWLVLGGTPATDDQVTVSVDGTQKIYTVQAGDTLEDVAVGLAALFNADTSWDDHHLASCLYQTVFFKSLVQGSEYEGRTCAASVSGGSSITVAWNDEDEQLKKMFKRILIELDDDDWRVGRIGVFGEVGTRTRADHPIFLSVRKSLATLNETLFFDKDVTDLTDDANIDLAFVTDVVVADDVGGEIRLYRGIERDYVDNFVGDGSTLDFELDYNAVGISSHIAVTVDSVPQTWGTDCWLVEGSTPSKSFLRFKSQSVPGNGDAVVVTYDAVLRLALAFVQASSSQQLHFGAPVKLEQQAGHFLIVTVLNKSANAAVVGVSANGFYEIKRGVVG